MQFEPDDEKQERNAEFGHCHDVLGIAHEPEQRGADNRAADQIAQRRTQPQLAEDRDFASWKLTPLILEPCGGDKR